MTSGAPNRQVTFPEELPISSRVRDIAQAIFEHRVIIVAGETGSGKTTQLPKICLAMGRGLTGQIGVTQPRRLAATSVAERVAKELGVSLGREVGYQVRFSNKTGPETYVKFMTDGILLREISADPNLSRYDTLIIDEAHERSLNIDFAMGHLLRVARARDDLRVIISSATLETARFSAFFDKAPVIEVSGRTYPVEVIYRPRTDEETDLADAIANTVEEISEIDRRGDVLVFLPGEREILEAKSALEERALPFTTILPLFGRLSHADQMKVFAPSSNRRIILSTNVAETSLTIAGVVYVIDAGVARTNRYEPRSGITRLLVEPVSKASANQRKGRAGRTRPGVCFRLYEESDFESRDDHTDPEILRVGLASAILQLKALGLGDLRDFSLIDSPPKRAVDEGIRVLEELGALGPEGELTEIGGHLARLPLDPRLGRMLLGGEQEGALREAIILAAAQGIQDPRERPLGKERAAEAAHRKLADENSDFLSLLKLFSAFETETRGKTQAFVKTWCRDRYLSLLRMKEWASVRSELESIARDLGLKGASARPHPDAVHKAILPGLLSRIGIYSREKRSFAGARQTRFVLHPSSVLAKKPPPWVMVAELVETSQLFGRTAAPIDPEWLVPLSPHVFRKNYGDPHYTEKRGEVVARENISLFGLPISSGKNVSYGPINPAEARRIFITHALARQEHEPKAEYITHNRKILEEVADLRGRARKSSFASDEDALIRWFDARIPDDVHSVKSFEAFRATKDPNYLSFGIEDILSVEYGELGPDKFPAEVTVLGASLGVTYKFDPSEEDDGATLTMPIEMLASLGPDELSFIVPGWLPEKVSLLLESLPRSIKKALPALRDVVTELVPSLEARTDLLPALSEGLAARYGVRVSTATLRMAELPPYLTYFVRVTDGEKVVGESRDLAALIERLLPRGREAFLRLAWGPFESHGHRALPSKWPSDVRAPVRGATSLRGYAAFASAGSTFSVRVVPTPSEAATLTKEALTALVFEAQKTSWEKLVKEAALTGFGLPGASASVARELIARALDETYFKGPLPTSEATFARWVASEGPAFRATFTELTRRVARTGGELTAVRAAMKGHPAHHPAMVDLEGQLGHLFEPGWVRRRSATELGILPLYLRAISVRLERLKSSHLKDAAKMELVRPHWLRYLQEHAALLRRGVSEASLRGYHLLVEELRVSVFAPELGTNVPVSARRLEEAWAALKSEAYL